MDANHEKDASMWQARIKYSLSFLFLSFSSYGWKCNLGSLTHSAGSIKKLLVILDSWVPCPGKMPRSWTNWDGPSSYLKGQEGTFWGAGNAQCYYLGIGYMGVHVCKKYQATHLKLVHLTKFMLYWKKTKKQKTQKCCPHRIPDRLNQNLSGESQALVLGKTLSRDSRVQPGFRMNMFKSAEILLKWRFWFSKLDGVWDSAFAASSRGSWCWTTLWVVRAKPNHGSPCSITSDSWDGHVSQMSICRWMDST